MKEYALYKGENLISMGTVSAIALETGKSRNMVRFLTYPAYKKRVAARKRHNDGALEMVELDDKEVS